MGYWDMFENNLEKMESLEKSYAYLIKDKDIDPFNDDSCVTKIYGRRNEKGFAERAGMLKKNISFFGIFCAG